MPPVCKAVSENADVSSRKYRRRRTPYRYRNAVSRVYMKREAGGVICPRGDTARVRAAIATASATRNSHEEGTPLRGAYYISRGVASPRSGT